MKFEKKNRNSNLNLLPSYLYKKKTKNSPNFRFGIKNRLINHLQTFF